MAKLVLGVLMVVVWWMIHALQVDEELAMNTVHEAKRAVDRAAHAAAQQLDRNALEMGTITLDPDLAKETGYAYLQANLRLDASFDPLPGSMLREQVVVKQFVVIGEEASFPYTYRNELYDYEVTLVRPGVILIVHLSFPRLFGVLAPVSWDLKGSAETVYA